MVGVGLLAACGGRSGLDSSGTSDFVRAEAGSPAQGGGRTGVGGANIRGGSETGGNSLGGGPGAASSGGSAGSVTGGSAGSGGSSGEVGGSTAGSAGSSGNGGWYVDPVLGKDTASGGFEAPFKTLERAAAAARDGETVWLFDGRYDAASEPRFADSEAVDCGVAAGVAFAPDVQIKALHSGKAQLLVAGGHGLCLAGGLVSGLRFECERPGRRIVEVVAGVQTIHESSFTNCGTPSYNTIIRDNAALDVSGDARVTLTSGTLQDYSGHPNYTLGSVRDSASLTVVGGTVTFQHDGFLASGSAVLDLEGVTLVGQNPSARADRAIAVIGGVPQVIVGRGTSIAHCADGIAGGGANPLLAVDHASFRDCGVGIVASGARGTVLRGSITNCDFTTVDTGVRIAPFAESVELSLSHLTFTAVARPIFALLGGRLSLTDITIADCEFPSSINALATSTPLDVVLRRVSIRGCQSGGLSLAGAAQVFDLGTSASPGENVLRDNQRGGTGSNLYFNSSGLISAIGNTWDPDVQGTDSTGRCSVANVGESFDLSEASGPNFSSGSGNQAILRLAENP
jgi:hypothetical protein